ncbi:MAG: hypothetical protein M3M84_06905 [Thermoproteota archaeon]|nr:hypothetical protein [Thermoproteota archaeon]
MGTAAAGQQQNPEDLACVVPGSFSLTDNNVYEPNRFNYCKMEKRDKQKPLTTCLLSIIKLFTDHPLTCFNHLLLDGEFC